MGNGTEEYIGCKTTFRVKHETDLLSGDIQNVDTENRTITFYKVTVHKPGKLPKVFSGLQQYHIDEIADLEITSEVNHALKRASLGKPFERRKAVEKDTKGILHQKGSPRHLEDWQDFDSTLLYMMNIVEKQMELSKDENGQYESRLPTDCTLLDDCDSRLFNEAIDHLKMCSTVGVAFEGVNLGRKGQLSWILVSTGNHTMFFDIKTMGKKSFDAGIREFLQSPRIMKVIHDCRRPSDILHHQYGTKLVNIFDTQVGAVHAFKVLNKNSYPRFVTSLGDCLRSELHLSEDDIHVPFLREHSPQKDEEAWNLRPAPSIVYEWMHKHSRHLLALRDRQMELMLLEFTMGVDIYLKNLRDIYDSEAEVRMTLQHLLPTEYTDLPLLVKTRLRAEQQKKVKGRLDNVVSTDENGWVENWTGIYHPQVIASRDGIWHMKPKPTEMRDPDKPPQASRKQTGTLMSRLGHCPGGEAGKTPQHGPVSSEQPLLRNGPVVQPGSSWEMTNGCDKMSSSSASDSEHSLRKPTAFLKSAVTATASDSVTEGKHSVVDSAPKTKGKTESDASDIVASFLSQLTKGNRENEQNEKNFHNMNYVFRPAGEMTQTVSRKKLKELESLRTSTAGDLASKSVATCPVEDLDFEQEFDSIPSRSKFQRSEQGFGDVFVPRQDCTSEENGGFDITVFREAIPPPPYTVTEQTCKQGAEEALAAILPRVENKSLLLSGSRTCSSNHSSVSYLQQNGRESGAGDADNRPVSRRLCETRHGVSGSGEMVSKKPPVGSNSAASDLGDGYRSADDRLCTPVRSPVCVGRASERGCGTVSAVQGSDVPAKFKLPSQKGVENRNAGSSSSSFKSLSPSGRMQEKSVVTCRSAAVVPSDPQASPAAGVGRESADGVVSSQVMKAGATSSPSEVGSPSAVSPSAPSSNTASNGLSESEIRDAVAKGESVLSILGFKISPQKMMSSKFKQKQDERQN